MNLLSDMIRKTTGIIYLAGNGGSAANASHFACDLIKLGYGAFSLSDNGPAISMITNDYGFGFIFRDQMKRATPNDLLIVMSVSGMSANVINAAKYAMHIHMPVIGLTGKHGGVMAGLTTFCYHATSDDYRDAENEHLAYIHEVIAELENG